jgi:hypothetical protein
LQHRQHSSTVNKTTPTAPSTQQFRYAQQFIDNPSALLGSNPSASARQHGWSTVHEHGVSAPNQHEDEVAQNTLANDRSIAKC